MAYDTDVALRGLRTQIDSVRLRAVGSLQWSDADKLLAELRNLAITMQNAGVAAYASLCFHLAERMEDLRLRGELPRIILLWLDLWVDNSESYLSTPARNTAWALLAQLNDPIWGSSFSELELNLLSHALTHPRVQHATGSFGTPATRRLCE